MKTNLNPVTPKFSARPPKEELWSCVESNGDGSYSSKLFTSKEEAEKYADHVDEEYGEGRPEVDSVDKIYETAQEVIDFYA